MSRVLRLNSITDEQPTPHTTLRRTTVRYGAAISEEVLDAIRASHPAEFDGISFPLPALDRELMKTGAVPITETVACSSSDGPMIYFTLAARNDTMVQRRLIAMTIESYCAKVLEG